MWYSEMIINPSTIAWDFLSCHVITKQLLYLTIQLWLYCQGLLLTSSYPSNEGNGEFISLFVKEYYLETIINTFLFPKSQYLCVVQNCSSYQFKCSNLYQLTEVAILTFKLQIFSLQTTLLMQICKHVTALRQFNFIMENLFT